MLEISSIVMLIEAGIFLVTLILLNEWLFKPLLSHMEKRDADLETKLKSVSSNIDEVKKYEQEIASIKENAKVEAAKIKKIAADQAKVEATKLVESAVKEIEADKNAFNLELKTHKEELFNELKNNESELKTMLSTKLKGIA